MDNKEKKVLEEVGLLYPAPNCIEYCQIVKATADEVAQRIFEAMSNTVTVVRCKDCVYFDAEEKVCVDMMTADEDGYCAWGERRKDGKTKERDY